MRSRDGTARLLIDFARPYKVSLLVILAAMAVETLTGLAAPWPLKIVIDDVAAPNRPANWPTLAALAAAGVVVIALVDGVASYVDR